jgi:hypothetical protein
MRKARMGLTLVEVLVVIGILALLVGILLPAVQNVRLAALRLKDANKMRQISLAGLQVADSRGGALPAFREPEGSTLPRVPSRETPFPAILYHVWQTSPVDFGEHPQLEGYQNRFYQSPADPSFGMVENNFGHVSYAANQTVFRLGINLNSSFQDGLSNTIFWTTHYAQCGTSGGFDFWYADPSIHSIHPPHSGINPGVIWESNVWFGVPRRASFSDRDCGDNYPGPSPDNPNVTISVAQHRPGSYYHIRMFQLAPTVKDCNAYVPNSPYKTGILVAMGDGSVRFLSGTVSESTFWSAVTPAGGEVLGGDW